MGSEAVILRYFKALRHRKACVIWRWRERYAGAIEGNPSRPSRPIVNPVKSGPDMGITFRTRSIDTRFDSADGWSAPRSERMFMDKFERAMDLRKVDKVVSDAFVTYVSEEAWGL